MNQRSKMLAVAVALLLGVGVVAMTLFAGEEARDTKRYHSSLQVPHNDGKDENESDENEAAEAAQLQSLAKITRQQAVNAFVKQVPAKVGKVELDNEDGNLVYSVEVKTSDGTSEVIVDAGNVKVLFVDRDEDDEDDDND